MALHSFAFTPELSLRDCQSNQWLSTTDLEEYRYHGKAYPFLTKSRDCFLDRKSPWMFTFCPCTILPKAKRTTLPSMLIPFVIICAKLQEFPVLMHPHMTSEDTI
mmetsp:Transcript_3593/g.9802  ORF Transcript_3593/g.9802 Transcript_3593/m.9802 type:complete len:105 (+) Transcript_3593:788-1102(+)